MPRKTKTSKRSQPAWSKSKGTPGLVHVYTGDGKGKTTTALGLILRASGHGLKCCLVQFMKGKFPYGEIKALKRLTGVTVRQFGTLKFVQKDKARSIDIREAKKAMEFSRKALSSGRYDLVILDEICVAEYMGLVPIQDIIDAVKARAPRVEAVLTGRKAHERLLALADYVTRFDKISHPFDWGHEARKGIEF